MQKSNLKKQSLFDFPIGRKAKVCSYDNENLEIPTKILEMGILPDTQVVVLHKGLFNGPLYIEYGVEKTRVALRASEAKFILVESVE